MGYEDPQFIQQHADHVPDPTVFEWVELFKEFWPGLVALGVAWMTLEGLKIKRGIDKRNKQRLIDLAKENREHEYKEQEETMMNYFRKK